MQSSSAVETILEKITRDFKDEIVHHHFSAPRRAEYSDPENPLKRELKTVLEKKGIKGLFVHQAQGINFIREGHNVVIMTPTASGKSLIYNIPVLESILHDVSSKALYLFPLKGLEQDQIKTLREFTADLDIVNPAEVYDGDTTAYRRKKIRQALPNIIFSNPDMLHLAINAFHAKWEEFFKNLKFVVIDEIHIYRGVFGSHVAQVLRRLRRICHYYGSNPQFIACSATIANPGELAHKLTGVHYKVIDKSTAPSAGKHFIFLNPWGSTYTLAIKIFKLCLDAGLKTIAFTKSRKITELMYSWLVDMSDNYIDVVSPYRAGFLPSERREIEQKLFSGQLQGVLSTSALELGIDIGGLDACILTGYPGSIASTWQRAGRVGRQRQDAVIAMVGLKNALDQYFMHHPDDFFKRSHEAVIVDVLNTSILKKHLPCALAEVPLKKDDLVYDTETIQPVLNELQREGLLRHRGQDDTWFSTRQYPQREVSIREIGETFTVYSGDRRIGEIGGVRVFKEAYPGAIYLHKGVQYRVEELDIVNRKIHCRAADVNYYTQVITHEETEVLNELKRRKNISWGNLITTHSVTGYWKKRLHSQEKISRYPLDLPSWTFETQGLWIKLNSGMEDYSSGRNFDFAGGLHALEHVMIAALPLFAMCDKDDVGGVSYTFYDDFSLPAIFLYDGFQGGVGLTKRGFEVIEMWFDATEKIITECPCESGCPSCVQDSQCGSGNEPLDKKAALFILRAVKKALQ